MGQGAGVYPVTKKLRRLFPKLCGNQYRLVSQRTNIYNCLAWAAGRNDVWSEAPPDGAWPDGVFDETRLVRGTALSRAARVSPGVAGGGWGRRGQDASGVQIRAQLPASTFSTRAGGRFLTARRT